VQFRNNDIISIQAVNAGYEGAQDVEDIVLSKPVSATGNIEVWLCSSSSTLRSAVLFSVFLCCVPLARLCSAIFSMVHKFEEKSGLGQPRSDLGWTLVEPRFGQDLTKMVRPRGPLTLGLISGLTSDVPPYQGFKEGLRGQT
jgi:hypothetical protein